MGAWKKLNQQDVYLTTYTAKKSWTIESSSFNSQGSVRQYLAHSQSSTTFDLRDEDLTGGPDSGSDSARYHQPLVYRSIAQLYYQQYDTASGELLTSSSFDNYLESTLETGNRRLKKDAIVYSIPRNRIGTHIEPGTLSLGSEQYYWRSASFSSGGYAAEGKLVYDDGEGVLRRDNVFGSAIGNIIYSHGNVILTEGEAHAYYSEFADQDISWKSNVPIYTYNYTVRLSDYEFNFTQNPSAITGSSNRLRDNVTGSYFQPYITTIGLYNDSNELIAVAKLGKPLPKSQNTETTVQIKLDI